MDGMDLRTLRVKNRIPVKTIAKIMGMTSAPLSRRERGVLPFTEEERQRYLQAVEMCTSGKYPYEPTSKRMFIPQERHAKSGFCSVTQAAKLRELMLQLPQSRAEIAALANVNPVSIHYIFSGRVIRMPFFERLNQTVNNLLTQQNANTPAIEKQPIARPAKSEQNTTPLTDKQPQPKQAKSEHIHYTSCSLEQAKFAHNMVKVMGISRESISRYLGIPLHLLNGKLDGELPIFRPEYDALITYIYSQHSKPARQQIIPFE